MAALSTTSRNGSRTKPTTVRCGVYCRISVDDGPDQALSSTEAQQEAVLAYIASQRHAGWTALPDVYEDRGFSGGDTRRPAFQRLLRDVEAGEVDRIVVHRIDRLSRSLADFVRIMETLDRHGVGLVSVTQQLDTTSSMGKLTLNLLFSFAEFEREMIRERTRDKMRAARRRGQWTGGVPVLGYDIAEGRLVVNEAEAERVRAIFSTYLETRSLSSTIGEIRRRGWTTKRWVSAAGKAHGGGEFGKSTLQKLLTNPLYVGRIRAGDEIVDAEHEAIVDVETFEAVQACLAGNRVTNGSAPRTKRTALLAGILRCSACDAAMTRTATVKRRRSYAYYTCVRRQKEGAHVCPTAPVAASEIEAFVVDQVRGIGSDPKLIAAVVASAKAQAKARVKELANDVRMFDAEIKQLRGELSRARHDADDDRLAEITRRLKGTERRRRVAHETLVAVRSRTINRTGVSEALSEFDALWGRLTAREKHEALALLVERVEYDGASGEVAITFREGAVSLLPGGRP